MSDKVLNTMVDLKVFDNLVKEFNEQFTKTQAIKDSGNANTPEYVAEAAKCLGLISSISYEASYLAQDFVKDMKINSVPSGAFDAGGLDAIASLAEIFKPQTDKKKN